MAIEQRKNTEVHCALGGVEQQEMYVSCEEEEDECTLCGEEEDVRMN